MCNFTFCGIVIFLDIKVERRKLEPHEIKYVYSNAYTISGFLIHVILVNEGGMFTVHVSCHSKVISRICGKT